MREKETRLAVDRLDTSFAPFRTKSMIETGDVRNQKNKKKKKKEGRISVADTMYTYPCIIRRLALKEINEPKRR